MKEKKKPHKTKLKTALGFGQKFILWKTTFVIVPQDVN